MKKNILLITFCASIMLISCGSTPKNTNTQYYETREAEPAPLAATPAPAWYINKEAVFESDVYISAIGSGYTRSEAAADAEIALANYFGHNVKSSVTGNTKSEMDETGNLKSNRVLEKEYVITLDVDLFAIEKTKPWYNVDTESYYICAYLERSKAFDIYLPTLLDAQKDFYNFYDASIQETDLFKKIGLLKETKIIAKKYSEVLTFAQLLAPSFVRKYEGDFDKISNVNILLNQTQNNAAVKVMAKKDYGTKIKDLVTKIVVDNGFIVSDTSYQYIVDVDFDEALIEDDYSGLLSATPSITISLNEKNSGDIPFSYAKSFQIVKSYKKELIEKKAFNEIEQELNDSFDKELNNFLLNH